jgi:hypothetical protein
VVLTWTSIICRLSPVTLTARMSVRSSPSLVSAGAQLCRASIEATQCSPADLTIFVSTRETVFAHGRGSAAPLMRRTVAKTERQTATQMRLKMRLSRREPGRPARATRLCPLISGRWRRAVAQGFEPWEACTSHAFEACSLGHSDTPPRTRIHGP